jgi:hypothetical protein
MRPTPLRILASLVLLSIAAACTAPAPKTSTTFDPQYNFSKVHKIYIEPFNRADPATITVTDDQIVRITAALEAGLRNKGFEIAAFTKEADLLLTWLLVTPEQVNMSSYDSARYADTGEKMGKYTDGTLVVDMSDPIRLQAVWRSDYKAEIKTTEDPQQNAAVLKAAVQALFADFPPTTAASR